MLACVFVQELLYLLSRLFRHRQEVVTGGISSVESLQLYDNVVLSLQNLLEAIVRDSSPKGIEFHVYGWKSLLDALTSLGKSSATALRVFSQNKVELVSSGCKIVAHLLCVVIVFV